MRQLYLNIVAGLALSVGIGIQPDFATSATVLPADDASKVIVIHNLVIKDGAVSCDLVNKSDRTIRDVQLLIRHVWHWKNEFRPSDDSPGEAVFHTVEREILPEKTMPFTYNPSTPLPALPDGYFETKVSVAGFTEVVP
jgi:hypothetical protein